MTISIIVAASTNNVIGIDNDLPWRLSNDLKHFKELTTGHHIIMGRKNYESIGRALPNRTSIIISRDPNYTAEGCIVVASVKEAFEAVAVNEEEVFIIGGGQIYKQTLAIADKIYLTRVDAIIEGDVTFPTLGDEWEMTADIPFLKDEKHKFNYNFQEFKRSIESTLR